MRAGIVFFPLSCVDRGLCVCVFVYNGQNANCRLSSFTVDQPENVLLIVSFRSFVQISNFEFVCCVDMVIVTAKLF